MGKLFLKRKVPMDKFIKKKLISEEVKNDILNLNLDLAIQGMKRHIDKIFDFIDKNSIFWNYDVMECKNPENLDQEAKEREYDRLANSFSWRWMIWFVLIYWIIWKISNKWKKSDWSQASLSRGYWLRVLASLFWNGLHSQIIFIDEVRYSVDPFHQVVFDFGNLVSIYFLQFFKKLSTLIWNEFLISSFIEEFSPSRWINVDFLPSIYSEVFQNLFLGVC